MSEAPGPTVREFDMLRTQVEVGQKRLAEIDDHGSRGVTGLTVQMTELVKDIGELKGDFNALKVDVERRFDGLRSEVETRFRDHSIEHQAEIKDRAKGRRWVIGTMIAAVIALCAVITLLIYIVQTMQSGH